MHRTTANTNQFQCHLTEKQQKVSEKMTEKKIGKTKARLILLWKVRHKSRQSMSN